MPIDAKWLPLGVAYREENPIKKSHTHTHTHTFVKWISPMLTFVKWISRHPAEKASLMTAKSIK